MGPAPPLFFRELFLLPGPSRRQAPVIKCNAFLCFQSYIVRDISLTEIYRWLVTFIEILSAILKSTSGGVKRKIIAFWTTRFPAFMSKNLRVNIWRDKFTSDRLTGADLGVVRVVRSNPLNPWIMMLLYRNWQNSNPGECCWLIPFLRNHEFLI